MPLTETLLSPRRIWLRRLVLAAMALAVNATLFGLLAILNNAARAEGEDTRVTSTKWLVRPIERPKPPEPPSPPDTAPETPTVSLDIPVQPVTPPPPPPLDISLAKPTHTPVDVSALRFPVRQTKKENQESRPPVRPGPASNPAPAKVPASTEPGDADSVDQPPREGNCPPPRYPTNARRRGIEGSVLVRLLISEEGRVDDVQLVEGAEYEGFNDAVLSRVRDWTFEPARDKGRVIKVWALKRIDFVLEK